MIFNIFYINADSGSVHVIYSTFDQHCGLFDQEFVPQKSIILLAMLFWNR